MYKKRIRYLPLILAALTVFLAVGCDEYKLYNELDDLRAATPLTLEPGSVSVATGAQVVFAVTGGDTPYTYEVLSGCGSIDAKGLFTAPDAPCTAQIRVTSANGRVGQATVIVVGGAPLAIVPAAIELGRNQSHQFAASGGRPPYVFSFGRGVGGITAAGLYTVGDEVGTAQVQVEDAAGNIRTAAVTVSSTVPAGPTLNYTSVTLYTGSVIEFVASGGTPPYTFAVIGGGDAVDGAISTDGTYSAPTDPAVDTVRVTDAANKTKDAVVEVILPLGISPIQAEVAVGQSVTFSATGGKSPYKFSLFSGTGEVVGTQYTAKSAGTDRVQVKDDVGNRATAVITVLDPGVVFTESEPNDTRGEAQELPFSIAAGDVYLVNGNADGDAGSDMYRFETGTASSVRITVTWSGLNDLFDLYVINPGGVLMAKAESADAFQETLDLSQPEETRIVELRPRQGAGNPYTLSITGLN